MWAVMTDWHLSLPYWATEEQGKRSDSSMSLRFSRFSHVTRLSYVIVSWGQRRPRPWSSLRSCKMALPLGPWIPAIWRTATSQTFNIPIQLPNSKITAASILLLFCMWNMWAQWNAQDRNSLAKLLFTGNCQETTLKELKNLQVDGGTASIQLGWLYHIASLCIVILSIVYVDYLLYVHAHTHTHTHTPIYTQTHIYCSGLCF